MEGEQAGSASELCGGERAGSAIGQDEACGASSPDTVGLVVWRGGRGSFLGVGLRPRGAGRAGTAGKSSEDLAIHWMRDSDAHHQQ